MDLTNGRRPKAWLAIGGLAAAFAFATEPAPRDFGFGPLEIYEFRHGTSELTVTDVNGDGRDDIVFLNNHASRIEILLRKPAADSSAPTELEDRFDNAGMLVDQQILHYALADLNGDGRKDLVTFGPTLGLHVRRQEQAGAFGQPERIHLDRMQDVVGLRVADVSGNGAADIAICRRNGAELLLNNGAGRFPARRLATISEENCTGMEWLDVSGNGRMDAVFFTQSQDAPVRVRLQEPDGRFGMEQLLSMPPMRFMASVPDSDGPSPRLGGILRNGLGFRLYSFDDQAAPPLLEAQEAVPERLVLQGLDRRQPPVWLTADFNGNGYDDVLVAAPELSQIHVYHGGPTGLRAEPQAVDSLAGVQAMAVTAGGEILVLSKRENAAALHDKARLDVFPSLLALPGPPLAAAVAPGTDHLLILCHNENRQWVLAERRARDEAIATRELDGRDEPTGMTVLDMGEGRLGMLLFLPHAPPAMFRVTPEAIERMTTAEFGALALRLTSRHLLAAPGPDADAALVAFGKTGRWFAPEDGGYRPLLQFNPGNEQADIAAACLIPGTNEANGVMLYDRQARNLIGFAADTAEPMARIHVRHAPAEATGMAWLRNPDRDTLLLVARDSLNILSGRAKRLTLAPGPEYMSAADKPSLRYFRPVALGQPPRTRLALADAANRSIEWIGLRDGQWRRYAAFEVFHDSGFGAMSGAPASGMEPRALAAGDLDGNGIGDMVVLVHDKLLVYPGK